MEPDTQASTQPLRVLLVNDDLFFSARILSVLKGLGHEALSAATLEDAARKLHEDPAVVILNFGSARVGGVQGVEKLKSAGAERIIGFLSHVKIPDVREIAIVAGLDRLVPNSSITQHLPEILAQLTKHGEIVGTLVLGFLDTGRGALSTFSTQEEGFYLAGVQAETEEDGTIVRLGKSQSWTLSTDQ